MTRRLSPTHVRQIRALARTGCSQAELARLYGVSDANISQIVRRHTYRDVPDFVSGERWNVRRV